MKNQVDIVKGTFLSVVDRWLKAEQLYEQYYQYVCSNFDLLQNVWEEFGFFYIAPIVLCSKRAAQTPADFVNVNPLATEWTQRIVDAIFSGNAANKSIVAEIQKGVQCYEKDIDPQWDVAVDMALVNAILEYWSQWICASEQAALSLLVDAYNMPLTCHKQHSFGIINPWPGDKSAEAEVLTRMKAAADAAGLNCVFLSDFGHILDPITQKKTDDFVNPRNLDFVITTHYETYKCLDNFYYHTLWNPPEIPLNLDYYSDRVTSNYLMNDDYLIYDDGGMSNHLRAMLLDKPRTLEGATALTASFPKNRILKPSLKDPKMFYCGMNWEKVVSNSNRHEGLFQLLDNTGKVKFFGPEKVAAWGGIRPWEGYACYQYSIPFDGFSILQEINDCGICLVLSSDIHRRAGAATNRTYEACAAGAVIISDNNSFMLKHFKDAALFIDYNKDNPQDTFSQLMQQYDWIVNHKEEALQLAEKAQQVFLEKFALDDQLKSLVQNHPRRFNTVSGDLLAQKQDKRVLVTYIIDTLDIEQAKILMDPVIQNVQNQYYSNIELAFGVDYRIEVDCETYCKLCSKCITIKGLPIFDDRRCRVMTDGQALTKIWNSVQHDYFVNTCHQETWFQDHIASLLRVFENDSEVFVSYCGRVFEDDAGFRRTDMFGKVTTAHAIAQFPKWLPRPGQFMFCAQAHKYLPDYLFDCLDGQEHYACFNLLNYRYRKKTAFSYRMTMSFIFSSDYGRGTVVPEDKQMRFIKDLVKYDILDMPTPAVNMIDRPAIASAINNLPLKLLLHIRAYKIMLRFFTKNKKLRRRYEQLLQKYFNVMSSV